MDRGEAMWGVLVVPQWLPIGSAIEEIGLVLECSQQEEWRNASITCLWSEGKVYSNASRPSGVPSPMSQANGVHPASHLHLAVTVPKSTTSLSLPHNSERPSQGAIDLIKVRIRGANLTAGGALTKKDGWGLASNRLDSLSYSGAGEGIRTLLEG
jgi:hypothetical protein